MLKRISALCGIYILMCTLAHGQSLQRYEHWIDNDVSQHTVVKSTTEDLAISVDLKAMSEGVHYFNFRAQNTGNVWGALCRYLFFIPNKQSTDTSLSSYEYWIDNELSGKTVKSDTGTEVVISYDISSLPAGVHYFNYRSRNSNGTYGALERYLLFIPTRENPNAQLSKYEYWLDNGIEQKTTVNSSSGEEILTIDLKDVTNGVHYLNYRACSSNGTWGVLQRFLFFKPDEATISTSLIDAYEYSFSAKKDTVLLTPTSVFEASDMVIPIPTLAECSPIDSDCNFIFAADNVVMSRKTTVPFSIRFRNESGKWSTPVVETIAMEDTIGHKPELLAVQKSVEFDKMSIGDYRTFRMNISATGNFYFKASQPCRIDLYNTDGTLFRTMNEAELLKSKQVGLPEGTYYGVVHSTRTDESYPAKTILVRLLLTEGYVPTPEIAFNDGTVAINCLQEGAKIYYTTDGNDPTTESAVYSAPFKVLTNLTVKAMATYEGLSPSDIAVFKVNSYKTEQPVIEFANLKLYMTCTTPESSIYYTLDGSDPATKGQLYTEPVSVSQNCTVKAVAKRDGYNDSDVTAYLFNVDNVSCVAPTFVLKDNLLTLSTLTEGATIHYTMDGSEPSEKSAVYKEPILLKHNCKIKAMTAKAGFISSAVTTYTVDWFQADMPKIEYKDGVVTITSSVSDAQIYYTIDGSKPTEDANLYTKPFACDKNCTVKAIVVHPLFITSEVATYVIDWIKVDKPTIKYDGRYAMLSTATADAVIHYTTDGSTPSSSSDVYTGPIDLNGLFTLQAIAMKPGFNDGEIASFKAEYYFNGTDLLTSAYGVVEKAFEWSGTSNVAALWCKAKVNASDISFLASMPDLQHLDMEGVTIENSALQARAFAGSGIISLSLPKGIESVGESLFESCSNLAAIQWNSSRQLPSTAMAGFENPNLLLYVKINSLAPSSVANVVAADFAESIVLTDGEGNCNFYCPRPFTAKLISYTHNYAMKTKTGTCQGWETIALPFDVQTVTHSKRGEIAPFSAMRSDAKPFWLYSLSETGFQEADKIQANTPYIISMPNYEVYDDDYILTGDVTFKAEYVTVPTTEQNISSKGDFMFVPTTLGAKQNTDVYAINKNEEYNGQLPGSMFVGDLRPISPFEGYLAFESKISKTIIVRLNELGLDDDTPNAIGIPTQQDGLKIWTSQGKIFINSDKAREVKVHALSGALVRSVEIHQGVNVIDGLQQGVYIVNQTKVRVYK